MKVSRAAETTGPLGAAIEVDRARRSDGVVVVSLCGDLDVSSVPRLRAALNDHIGSVDVVLDMAGVVFCDSSALRVFVEAQRRAAAAGRRVEIAHPSAPLRSLLEVSGLREVLCVTS